MNLQTVLERRKEVAEFQRKHRIGVLTLLFTDIVGSTQLKQDLGDLAAHTLMLEHHSLVRELLREFREAAEIATAGDAFFLVFAKPSDAVKFSLLLHAHLRAWSAAKPCPVLDRVGLHVGEVVIEDQDESGLPTALFGIQIDTCSRVMSLGEGGQTLMSRSAFDNASHVLKGQPIEGVGELVWLSHGFYVLKGLTCPLEICEVGERGLALLRAPADTDKAYQRVSADQMAQLFTGRVETGVRPTPQAAEEDRRNLRLLGDRVRQFWVEGVLDHSLLGTQLLLLGSEAASGAVENPWERLLGAPEVAARAIPPNKKIAEVFDDAGRCLLILGEPGSGKTIALLELTRDLLARCRDDASQPVPVVFNLSSWNERKQGFGDWLAEELRAKYYVPMLVGRSWLEKNQLVLLLDGLDEVRPDNQAACVLAINGFVAEAGVPGLAVCSRLREYTALPVRFKLNAAVCLQPLTWEQVDGYLTRGGVGLADLRTTLAADPALQELATSPLMLGVMIAAYQNRSAKALVPAGEDNVGGRHNLVLRAYVERMFERPSKRNLHYTREQSKDWLAWLARKMKDHSQTVFLVEQLQPSWLSSPKQVWLYIHGSRMALGLLAGAPVAAFVATNEQFIFSRSTWLYAAIQGIAFGMCWQLIGRLGWRLLAGLTCAAAATLLPQMAGHVSHEPFIFLLLGILAGQLAACLDLASLGGQNPGSASNEVAKQNRAGISRSLCGLGVGLNAGIICFNTFGQGYRIDLFDGLFQGLVVGLSWGLVFRLRGQSGSRDGDVRAVETLVWSMRKALHGGFWWLASAMGLGVIHFLLWTLLFGKFAYLKAIDYLDAPLTFAPAGLFLGVVFGGLRSGLAQAKGRPNDGMRLSLRNATLAAAAVTIGAWGGAALTRLFHWGTHVYPATLAIMLAAFFGPLGALWYGGVDLIRHYALRAILIANRLAPRRFIPFLDNAVRLALLQRVGGGYMFRHRLLLEYFADMHPQGHHAPRHRFPKNLYQCMADRYTQPMNDDRL